MSLQRKAIRDAVVALLQGHTDAGQRVFTNRTRPIDEPDLPAIVVWTKSERSELFNQAPRRYKRTLTLMVEVIASQDTGLDDGLDAICEQIESVLAQHDQLNGTAADTRITGGEGMMDPDGSQLIGRWWIELEADYFKDAPEFLAESLGAFEGANIRYDIAPADTRIEAEDKLNLPQE